MAFQNLCLKFAVATSVASLVVLVAVFEGTYSAICYAYCNCKHLPHGIAVQLPFQIFNKRIHMCSGESAQSQNTHRQPHF